MNEHDLRVEALRLANGLDEPAHVTVDRARAYYAFLSGDLSPRGVIDAALDAAGVR